MSIRLVVKNMVCDRCIKVVKEDFIREGFDFESVTLGEVILKNNPTEEEKNKIKSILESEGFGLLEDRKAGLIEKVKIAVIRKFQENEIAEDFNFPEYIARELALDYNYISTLFSSTENITLEQFIILQRIEKVKELLRYGELSLSEIAFRLGYKTVQHLSAQFKSITGFTASEFKKLKNTSRNPVDKITF